MSWHEDLVNLNSFKQYPPQLVVIVPAAVKGITETQLLFEIFFPDLFEIQYLTHDNKSSSCPQVGNLRNEIRPQLCVVIVYCITNWPCKLPVLHRTIIQNGPVWTICPNKWRLCRYSRVNPLNKLRYPGKIPSKKSTDLWVNQLFNTFCWDEEYSKYH